MLTLHILKLVNDKLINLVVIQHCKYNVGTMEGGSAHRLGGARLNLGEAVGENVFLLV